MATNKVSEVERDPSAQCSAVQKITNEPNPPFQHQVSRLQIMVVETHTCDEDLCLVNISGCEFQTLLSSVIKIHHIPSIP